MQPANLHTFQSQFRNVLDQIKNFKHQKVLLQHSNRILQAQSNALKQSNLKEQQFLNQMTSQLDRLQLKRQSSFPQDQDFDKIHQNHSQITRYQSKIVNQHEIINRTVLNLPEKSLQKAQKYFSDFTPEKIIEAIQNSIQMSSILQKIEETKKKYQKQRLAQQKYLEKQENQNQNESQRQNESQKTYQGSF